MIIKAIFGEIPRGVVLIDDPNGEVARIFALQIADFALQRGMKVQYLTFFQPKLLIELMQTYGMDLHENSNMKIERIEKLPEFFEGDLVVIDPFTIFAIRMNSEDMMKLIQKLEESGKTFLLTHNSKILDEKFDAFLKFLCNSLIEIRTDLVGERIFRSLNLVKIRGARARNKLIKFTIEANGIQIDTREAIG